MPAPSPLNRRLSFLSKGTLVPTIPFSLHVGDDHSPFSRERHGMGTSPFFQGNGGYLSFLSKGGDGHFPSLMREGIGTSPSPRMAKGLPSLPFFSKEVGMITIPASFKGKGMGTCPPLQRGRGCPLFLSS